MRKALCLIAVALAAVFLAHGSMRANDKGHDGEDHDRARTPIRHVIVIIGENRTFDHIFGAYKPPQGQTVWNLRSEGIIKANGSPGPIPTERPPLPLFHRSVRRRLPKSACPIIY